ncbi:Glycosyl transferases group 1 [Pedobacter sp. ok626]|uniref:glycosyltransferase family 4 protein n=1 Tax=Pedobacter sp. ok626 TaxID=1761882 RepID=UPI00088CF8DB|nr:glycosyltransferase family 4 protein [Pedobacter sp. ok626]SDJ32336.1 Glycosyl transferases group 1 [Pedobacter sp. ok626]
MTRILIVNCVYDPEPVVSAQLGKSLAEKLSNEGHSVSVIAPFPSRPFGFSFNGTVKKKEVDKKVVNDQLTIYRLPSFTYPKSGIFGRLLESISFGWAAFKYVRRNSEDIDTVYMNTWPLFGQFGVAVACKTKKIKYLMHIQDVYPESLTNRLPRLFSKVVNLFLFPLEKYSVHNASRVIVISKKMQAYIASTRNIPENSIDVVLNWQDNKEFEPYKDSWNPGKLTFMYLGNIGAVSGLNFVLSAFIKTKLDARLIIAGNGAKREECMEIAKENPHIDIEFWEVPAGEVAKIQAQAHILILPLISGAASSSIPSKLPAYMFSGRPIIATLDKDSDTANAIRVASCGWVGPPEDEVWLKKTFVEVSTMNSSSLQRIGQSGRVYALNFFSKEVNLEKIIHAIIYG